MAEISRKSGRRVIESIDTKMYKAVITHFHQFNLLVSGTHRRDSVNLIRMGRIGIIVIAPSCKQLIFINHFFHICLIILILLL